MSEFKKKKQAPKLLPGYILFSCIRACKYIYIRSVVWWGLVTEVKMRTRRVSPVR